jgi:predicted SAM-dependent methyltransferase
VVVVVATSTQLNLGCGDYRVPGYLGIDQLPGAAVDLVLTVPPLLWPDASIHAIYMGHFLEHLDDQRGAELLREAYRVLEPGGGLGIVVPDFREVARRYLSAERAPFEMPAGAWHDLADLDELCRYILFSNYQASHHLWMYDVDTLGRALRRAGFEVTGEIDRFNDPRLSTPQWYQTGLQARKP